MGDLSDQLLVGTGFCARRSVVCRNSQQYVQGLLRWWTPLSKYVPSSWSWRRSARRWSGRTRADDLASSSRNWSASHAPLVIEPGSSVARSPTTKSRANGYDSAIEDQLPGGIGMARGRQFAVANRCGLQ
jgi:hypothetical protein